MKTKKILFLLVALIVVVGCLIYFFPRNQLAGTVSTAGSSFNTARYAGVSIDASVTGSTGTSSSITNLDATDRYITGVRGACQNVGTSKSAMGAGIASWQISIGTTSSANPISFSSAVAVAVGSIIPTSTASTVFSTSTQQIATSTNATLWATGVPLTFFLNATNTAQCTFGVDYIGS